ncbi:MAG: tRNA pseudouridine(13) synthase TruD [Phycisphaeraceae bacterium]|nr:tRNA pseudouridine(13) synthase TruD [Phycisphaeraceae bacterium]
MTIRRTPADFIVDEIAAPEFEGSLRAAPSADALVAVYRLDKSQLTTPHAVSLLAAELRVRQNDISYAGLKDKHAQTSQMVGVKARTLADGVLLPAEIRGGKWSARRIGWTVAPIDASAIAGNRFCIVVRGVSRAAAAEMDRRASLLATAGDDGGALLIVNYFGAQRFGSARHGEGWIARSLIDGKFEHALRLAIATPSRKDTGVTRTFTRMLAARWSEAAGAGRDGWAALARDLPRCPEKKAIERLAFMASRREAPIDERGYREAFAALPYFLQQLYVEAYQSYLWNELARRMAARIAAGQSLLKTDDEFGQMLFPPAAARAAAPGLFDLHLPLPAPETQPVEPWGGDLLAILEREGLALDRLKIPGLRRPFFGEAMRPLFITAAAFSLGDPEPDDLAAPRSSSMKRQVRFDLPRGAYATVVLRALGQ